MNQNKIINKILELKANNEDKKQIQFLQQKLDKANNKTNNKK